MWPRILTVRALVLFIVVLLAFVMLLPTVRGYLGQRSGLQALRADVIAAEERNEELEFQLGRWNDQAYVASQARERLAYVYPGETAFRVLDPESVVPAVNPETGKDVADGVVEMGFQDAPWYTTIWKSIEIADKIAVADDGAAKAPADGGAGKAKPPAIPPATAPATQPATPPAPPATK